MNHERKRSSEKKARARLLVDGVEHTPGARAKQPRSISQILKLDRSARKTPAPTEEERRLRARKARAYVRGVITLAQLEGLSRAELHQIAKVGHDALLSGQLHRAERIFKGLLALDPYDAYFHLAMGSVAERKAELGRAEASYSRAIQINPALASALANRGHVRLKLSRVDEAIRDLEQSLRADPEARHASTRRARATLVALKANESSTQRPRSEERAHDAADSKSERVPPKSSPTASERPKNEKLALARRTRKPHVRAPAPGRKPTPR